MVMQQAPAIKPPPDVSEADPTARIRGFVNMRNPNLTKLIQTGVLRSFPDPNSPSGRKDAGRDGDIKIVFKNGYWSGGRSEGDRERIKWCEKEAAKEDCQVKDVDDTQAKIWAELIAGQQVTGKRDPTVSPSVDVNAALRGEAALTTGGETLDRVRETIALQNEGQEASKPTEEEPPQRVPAGVPGSFLTENQPSQE